MNALTEEELETNAIKRSILFYRHNRAMIEAEKIVEIYAQDPLVYVQDETLNNLCHVIMRLWWAVKHNYTNPSLLSDKQKWDIYFEMKKRVREAHRAQTEGEE